MMTTVPTSANAHPISKLKEEKLIPLINVTRKLSSCDLYQQLKVLPHLARIFQSDEVSFSLMDIIVAGLCQSDIYEKIPSALCDEINSILPSDKELNLRDSVFESRLVEEQDPNEEVQTIKKNKKLPMTLLRIPTDVHCHIFHYLKFYELANVQTVCRAICIAARNPSAVHSMTLTPRFAEKVPFQNEYYSQPKKLKIWDDGSYSVPNPLIGNAKWGNHVKDLEIFNYDRIADMVFRKLERCKLFWSPNLLLNGSILCYHSLKELTLREIELTEDIIDQIQKFQTLEKLSLIHPDRNSDRLRYSDSIILPKLKLLSYAIPDDGFHEFQRFLIGSKPETVIEINAEEFTGHGDDNVSQTGMQIPNMSPIRQCNVICNTHSCFAETMGQWLLGAPLSTFKLFDEINVSIIEEIGYRNLNSQYMSSLIAMFQHCNQSKLDIMCAPLNLSDCDMSSVVNAISNAPFGTFTEIKMKMEFNLMSDCQRDDSQRYVEYLLDSLGDVERDEDIVRSIVMESADEADKWLEPWLLLDEEWMRQHGLERLVIDFNCDMQTDYYKLLRQMGFSMADKLSRFERIYSAMIDKLVSERVGRWNTRHKHCIVATKDQKGYSFTIAVQI